MAQPSSPRISTSVAGSDKSSRRGLLLLSAGAAVNDLSAGAPHCCTSPDLSRATEETEPVVTRSTSPNSSTMTGQSSGPFVPAPARSNRSWPQQTTSPCARTAQACLAWTERSTTSSAQRPPKHPVFFASELKALGRDPRNLFGSSALLHSLLTELRQPGGLRE